jgi:hypothetical protein
MHNWPDAKSSVSKSGNEENGWKKNFSCTALQSFVRICTYFTGNTGKANFYKRPGGVAQWTLHPPQEQENPGLNPARV